MRIGSLFSGYGGLDLAAQQYFGGGLAWYSEIEPAACQILAAHHPITPNLGDITLVDWATVQPIDILTGGYPCQPFSHAGKRKGSSDERHLWPFVATAIDALRPRIVILENVRGHLSLGFGDVLADLHRMGYDASWGVVRASDAGAPHGRARIFIVAYPEGERWGAWEGSATAATRRPGTGTSDGIQLSAYPDGKGSQGHADQAGTASTGRHGHAQQGACGSVAYPDIVGHERAGSARVGRAGSSYSDEPPSDTSGRGSRAFGPQRVSETGAAARLNGDSEPPPDTDGDGHGQQQDIARMGRVDAGDARPSRQRPRSIPDPRTVWGKYGVAINRWERVLGRAAPDPTIVGVNGRPRLNPVFVEWMMGLQLGHVTGHGLRPAQELKALGNGVCPQQAHLALTMILGEAS